MKVLILAAGLGKRMKSKYPKVVHKILGKPMINWVVDLGKKFGEVGVVVGHKAEIVKSYLPQDVKTYLQEPQLGTGHAVMCAKEFIVSEDDIVILYGDVPLLKPETIEKLAQTHARAKADVTVLTFIADDPTGYGRIIRNGEKIRIVEHKDANEEQLKIKEVNSGIYVFSGKFLLENLDKLSNNNAQGEYYLTDLVEMASKVETVLLDDPVQVSGVNDRVQLAQLESVAKERILKELMLSGVTVVDPASTFVGPDVKIGIDTIIHPFTILEGNITIGEDCEIGPYTRIKDSTIGNNVKIMRSEVEGAIIENNVSVGPFARLREGTVLKEKVKIGNFVETKKSVIGKNSKAQHLTYLGDATIGEDVNIGAGTITCNYDGYKKYPTSIGDGAFIGSNSSLVAPVKIGKGAIVGAGSVITEDVPDDALALGRARQVIKENWAKMKREAMENANHKE
ncbi:bifunctional UDP-N-acetylglucosamine pyrophosphorylase / Glucosamine-1-phosphate N-acetyltransferase [Fervidobacterium changbaicum]|uniref:Bifunctional protein GlmU n=1 Tax=Fervidobacterium changbaicum TaxID=310769 RepID=A0ABX5QQ51_9BACT|nr:bifunctional UDP-N-acetylglucosamine diphosphorylase/glucosamine-1-phosphate N-acetyltransferase GlmU [Fervidobacterium changbaicum]QAV32570.1 UDP-N-acetylglucosamine diphosphorylase/glucosamine-1-phosphate N-acetyltransferase [Fervidobacterium changbaicum]SDH66615.1 bifunctional UDP-N-acetylglucosamine pyrophosphorylase / Glucosamine-1-phosphate N-acetyltransferase [Fervidobacterium changbaicum]